MMIMKRKDSAMSIRGGGASRSSNKLYFVPFWIMLTFVFTFLCPNILQVVLKHLEYNNVRVICYCYVTAQYLFVAGCLVDVLIYIFMNKHMRNKFRKIVRWKRKRNDDDDVFLRSINTPSALPITENDDG